MRYTVYRIIVCSRTKIIMISSLRNFSVCILDADRFTIVVFQILDIKSNYLPGIVHSELPARQSDCHRGLPWGAGCVECWLAHCCSRCPLCMATDDDGCFRTCVNFKQGHVVKWPTSMVSHHVESDDDNRLA
jgi:hypothetical protein